MIISKLKQYKTSIIIISIILSIISIIAIYSTVKRDMLALGVSENEIIESMTSHWYFLSFLLIVPLVSFMRVVLVFIVYNYLMATTNKYVTGILTFISFKLSGVLAMGIITLYAVIANISMT